MGVEKGTVIEALDFDEDEEPKMSRGPSSRIGRGA